MRGLGAVDGAGAEVGVDRHLLAGHGVEHEARAHLGHALAALGDHDELNDGQNQEDHCSDHVVAAHHEGAERADDFACVGLQQDQPRRRYVEGEANQRRDQEQRGEGCDLQRFAHVQRDQENHDRAGDVRRDQQVEQPGRQRHDHQADDRDHERGEHRVGDPEARLRTRQIEGRVRGCS